MELDDREIGRNIWRSRREKGSKQKKLGVQAEICCLLER